MRQFFAIMICTMTVTCLQASGPDHMVAEFELANGFIIVEATVDGHTGAFIFDSGAPGLVLNSTYRTGSGVAIALAGVGGSVSGEIVTPITFALQHLQLENLEALSIDLTYLEEAVQRPIHGLIGLDLFAGYGVMIDYAQQAMRIVQSETEGFTAPHITLPIEMDGHVPVIILDNAGTQMRFGIDTGSRSNLISQQTVGNIESADYVKDIELIGADQQVILTSEVNISTLNSQGLCLGELPFVIADLSHTAEVLNAPIDGVLGHNFFQHRQMFINAERTGLLISGRMMKDDLVLNLIARR